ncbi:MAG: CPBP family intramembrane glutamic endopeptidase, partial [Acidimicrobiia bacterium]
SIPAAAAIGTWSVAWVVGAVVVTPIFVLLAGGSVGDDLSIEQLAVGTAGAWAVFVVALVLASRRFGTGDLRADLAVRFRPIDLVGVPLGVATQFVVVPLLYWPLRELWPDTFDPQRIEERAQDLADRAEGVATVLLVLVVVVGAPIVEELVYRGLVHRSLSVAAGASSGLLLTALLFALIHFSPVEYPGLVVAGLVFGACVTATGRLGPAIVTHAAFNAAGLAMVLWS